MLKLDRVLHGAAFYPHDYGFIPQTLCGDGDPLVREKIVLYRQAGWSVFLCFTAGGQEESSATFATLPLACRDEGLASCTAVFFCT